MGNRILWVVECFTDCVHGLGSELLRFVGEIFASDSGGDWWGVDVFLSCGLCNNLSYGFGCFSYNCPCARRRWEAGWAGEGGERGAIKLGLTCCNVLGGNLFPR